MIIYATAPNERVNAQYSRVNVQLNTNPMPETSPETTSPLPFFHFEVDFGENQRGIPFQEVSGLDTEAQIIEYRHDNQPSPIKMPGLSKITNITFRRGIFVNDNTFRNWLSGIKMNVVKRRTIVIRLIDNSGHTTMTWSLYNAWPTKITTTDLRSDGNEVAVDTMEVACEGMEVKGA